MPRAPTRSVWLLALAGASMVLAASGRGAAAPDTAEPERDSVTLLPSSVPVYLNHAFTVLPASTFEAMRASSWLGREFSNVEVRTTVRPDITYTGLYLSFERTYLELFEPSREFPLGASALALSDETAGGMAWVTERLGSAFGQQNVVTGTISRTVDGQDVPWFHVAAVDRTFSPLFSTWTMEYVTPPGASRPPTRLEDRAGRYHPDKLARDVVAVAYALAPADRQKLGQVLQVLGWQVRDPQRGPMTALSPLDGDTRRAVVVQSAPDLRTGIVAVAIRLNRHASHTEEMGEARLVAGVLGKKLAILSGQPLAGIDQFAAMASQLAQ